MKFTLTAAEDHNLGGLGWKDSRIRGSDIFGPLTGGVGLAHDLIEHAAFDSVADEIEAHGAMYRIRYESGWSGGRFGNNLNLAAFSYEWISLLRGLQEEPYLPIPPKTRRLDTEVEEDISEIIARGRKAIRDEFSYEEENGVAGYEADLDRLAEVFRAYFRIGYRKVAKRFKGLNSGQISCLFSEIADIFEKKRISFEGETLEVIVDLKNVRVRVEEKYPEEEYA